MKNTTKETLHFVEKSGEALEAAQQLAASVLEEGQKVASLTPVAVEGLTRLGLIQATEKSAAVKKLSSHVGAVEVIGNLLHLLGQQKAAEAQASKVASDNGKVVKPSQAKTASSRDVFVGRPYGTGGLTQADLALGESLGLHY